MNIALWIVQGILCAAFLVAGGMKLFAYEKFKASAEARSPTLGLGLSKGLVTVIGICELAGALGLVLPLATGVLPILTTWAAVGIGMIMILATVFHLQRKEPPAVTLVLLVLAGFVVYGRASW